jgi:SAM-dependent methyltransferase
MLFKRREFAIPFAPVVDLMQETVSIIDRYSRRYDGGRYSLLAPDMLYAVQERQRLLARWLRRCQLDVHRLTVLEVGCGSGAILLEWLRFGIRPEHLCGIELQATLANGARRRLPASLTVITGDASQVDIMPESRDLVCQFTVFSSLLEDRSQEELAVAMWRWVKPGGAIVWYDFVYDNPWNGDVRGVPVRRIRTLFPESQITWRRVTLAPVLARRLPPALYSAVNVIPWLRTHVFAWIAKPRGLQRSVMSVRKIPNED